MSTDEWCDSWLTLAETGDNPLGLPLFPSEEVQRITNNKSGVATMTGAALFYKIFLDETVKRFATEDLKVLDFGAGWGRITRLLLGAIGPHQITAVDIDERLVHAGNELLPELTFRQIEPMGSLPFTDGSFNVVYANSVFSHLSAPANLKVVAEIARVMEPGGVFLGTVLARHHIDTWRSSPASAEWIEGVLGDGDDAIKRVEKGEFVFGDTRRWPDYGIAIVPEGWMHEHWGRWFYIEEIRTDYSQNVPVAIRK